MSSPIAFFVGMVVGLLGAGFAGLCLYWVSPGTSAHRKSGCSIAQDQRRLDFLEDRQVVIKVVPLGRCFVHNPFEGKRWKGGLRDMIDTARGIARHRA